MKVNFDIHQPVLLDEVLQHLISRPDGVYVDATFGRGGHARAILQRLSPEGRLFAMDKDPEAVAYARQHFSQDPRFTIQQSPFTHLTAFLTDHHILGQVDGILFDLGVSSPQLDDPSRGFSFQKQGPLDMRMDPTTGVDAATLIAQIDEKDLAKILWELGEERFARRIAKAIVLSRQTKAIETTTELANIIAAAVPAWQIGKHPATRSFQALRIAVNHELDDLKSALEQSLHALKATGRLLVISFHSLEDRMVKQFIQYHERGDHFPAKLPVKHSETRPLLKRKGQAIKPSLQEVNKNPRARSAVLRIGEKLT